MTAEQIKELAAAGLSVEQIAAVADIMEPKKTPEELWRRDQRHTAISTAVLEYLERELTTRTDGDGWIHFRDGTKIMGGPGQVFLEKGGLTECIGDSAGPPFLTATEVAASHFIKSMAQKEADMQDMERLKVFQGAWKS